MVNIHKWPSACNCDRTLEDLRYFAFILSVFDNYLCVLGDQEPSDREPERPGADSESESDDGFTFDPKRIADRFQKWDMEDRERRKNVIDNPYNGVLVCLK